jgi:integrase/recombinase XerD
VRLPRDDPRRSLPFDEWPAADRDAWDRANRLAEDILEEPGGLAHLRPLTRDRYRSAYGRYLAYLQFNKLLLASERPAQRVSHERVVGYMRSMEDRIAPITILHRITGLYLVVRAFAPQENWAWLRRVLARVSQNGYPTRNKRAALLSSDKLISAGIDMMEKAELPDARHIRLRAADYRNGLMLALLAARPLRITNFANLELDRTLFRKGQHWTIEIGSADTKNGEDIDLPFPELLNQQLSRYLSSWRPVLMCGNESQRLWISVHGRPLDGHKIYKLFRKFTNQRFGCAMNPHLFRHCLATHVAIHDPEHMGIATALLGHRSMATTQMHYNLARSREAGKMMQATLLDLRRQARQTR